MTTFDTDEDYDSECEGCGLPCYEDDMSEGSMGELLCDGCFEDDLYDEDYSPIDGVGFANPGSALRAETSNNPRNLPCPTCKEPNRLTPIDSARGYQCDNCADSVERYG